MTHTTLYALRRPMQRVLNVLTDYPNTEELSARLCRPLSILPDVGPCPPPHAPDLQDRIRVLLADLALYATSHDLPLDHWWQDALEDARMDYLRAEMGKDVL